MAREIYDNDEIDIFNLILAKSIFQNNLERVKERDYVKLENKKQNKVINDNYLVTLANTNAIFTENLRKVKEK
jgi:hypothetical protein